MNGDWYIVNSKVKVKQNCTIKTYVWLHKNHFKSNIDELLGIHIDGQFCLIITLANFVKRQFESYIEFETYNGATF